MLNIMALTEAINGNTHEYATGTGYKFYGSIHECTAEFNHMVMVENADMQGFIVSADELLAEAALNNDDYRLSRLSESAFDSIKDGVSKFFKKIKDFVKGLIEKLKAFFYKLTGKTSKWLGVMKDKVLKAAGKSGAGNVTYSMHRWNTDYVLNGIRNGIKEIVDSATGDDVMTVDELQTKITSGMRTSAGDYKAVGDNADKQKESRETLSTNLKKAQDELEESRKKFDDDFPDRLAKAVGVGTANTVDDAWNEVAKKAKGDTNDKVEIKFVSEWGVDAMIAAIDNTSKTVDDLKKTYDKHLSDLDKLHKSWDQAMSKLKIDGEKDMASHVSTGIRTVATVCVGNMTHMISTIETAANTARGANIKYVQDMSHEFMNALTKLVSYKEEKK